jgi:hypothetical protein
MYSKIDIINREREAIEEAVASHTVGIVADDGQSIGTGSAILWRRHSLTLTAKHVIENSTDNVLWFYFRDEGAMKHSPLDTSEVRQHTLGRARWSYIEKPFVKAKEQRRIAAGAPTRGLGAGTRLPTAYAVQTDAQCKLQAFDIASIIAAFRCFATSLLALFASAALRSYSGAKS